jgi:hypothetical protein
VRSGGSLSHQGDGGSAAMDRQPGLDEILGIAQFAHGMPVADRQVGNDILEYALEGREIREGTEDALGKDTERAGVARAEPQHVSTEPARPVQLEPEHADSSEQFREPGERAGVDCLRRHEREEDRDVRRNTKRRAGIEPLPEVPHGRLGLGNLDDQAAAGNRSRHAEKGYAPGSGRPPPSICSVSSTVNRRESQRLSEGSAANGL